MLGVADVAGYLLDRRLLDARAIVDGDLRVVDRSRMNRVYVVTAEGERCLVLKVARSADDRGVAREAAILERLDSLGKLAPFLPRFVAYDRAERALVLESVPGARDLRRHHARGRFSCALAHEAGRALALLHALPPTALDGLEQPTDSTRRLRVHEPDLESIQTMSAAALELTRMIQGLDDLCTVLDGLAASSREESVIHGDVRWDNLLAARTADSKRWTRLQLIDWEHCGVGDPAVDIGDFFGEYLRTWLQSIPITDPRDPGRLLAHAGLPLRRMRPALRAFWDAYTRHSPETTTALRGRLKRAVPFAAVRLLTAALEEAQTLDRPRARVLYLVPLSRNILRRPDDAAAHLLGLKS